LGFSDKRKMPLHMEVACTIDAAILAGRKLSDLPPAQSAKTQPPWRKIQMNKKELFVACALFLVAALWAPTSSFAQSPFDGTWHTNIAQTKFSPKPNVFYLSQGWYHCVSCNPSFDVKADGQDQAVTGQTYDTVSVREVDPKSIALTTKKGGTTVSEQTRTVSANGKTLTIKNTYHPMGGGQPLTAETTATLVGIAPSGVHAAASPRFKTVTMASPPRTRPLAMNSACPQRRAATPPSSTAKTTRPPERIPTTLSL
jgi:hypothetical protein